MSVIREDKLQLLRHRWQFPLRATAGFALSCAGFAPFCIRLLLGAVYDGDMEINPLMEYPIPFFA